MPRIALTVVLLVAAGCLTPGEHDRERRYVTQADVSAEEDAARRAAFAERAEEMRERRAVELAAMPPRARCLAEAKDRYQSCTWLGDPRNLVDKALGLESHNPAKRYDTRQAIAMNREECRQRYQMDADICREQ